MLQMMTVSGAQHNRRLVVGDCIMLILDFIGVREVAKMVESGPHAVGVGEAGGDEAAELHAVLGFALDFTSCNPPYPREGRGQAPEDMFQLR